MSKTEKKILRIRANYEPSEDEGIYFEPDSSLTKQADAEGCDVNNILKNYSRTGLLPGATDAPQQFADVSDVDSYHEALNIVRHSENLFSQLNALTREKFVNDPAKFLAFVEDPRNAEELINMGLATKSEIVDPRPAAAPKQAPVATEGTPDGASGAKKS